MCRPSSLSHRICFREYIQKELLRIDLFCKTALFYSVASNTLKINFSCTAIALCMVCFLLDQAPFLVVVLLKNIYVHSEHDEIHESVITYAHSLQFQMYKIY